MLFGTIIGVLVALWLRVPVLTVLMWGALMQAVIAFTITKNKECLYMGGALLPIVAGQYLLLPLLFQAVDASPISPRSFEIVAYVASSLVLAICTFVGLRGPRYRRSKRARG